VSPQAYTDAASGGGAVLLADLETLPQAALGWLELVPTYAPLPESDFKLTSGDPASQALSLAIADWPTINQDRFTQLKAKANEFIAAVLVGTVPPMGNADQGGAGSIGGTQPP
jgi:hypothetical protein